VTIHYSSREKKYCQTNKNNRYKKFLLNKNILKKRKNKKNEEKKYKQNIRNKYFL